MKNRVEQFIFARADGGSDRLDQACVAVAPAYSRSYMQKLIEQGHIAVNGVVQTKPRTKISSGSTITITFPPSPTYAVQPSPVDFKIVGDYPDFMVINKPAGLAVHPAPSAPGEITLVHGLVHAFEGFKQFDDQMRPGIVHRLDKETSGLMVIAKNPQALLALGRIFQNRTIIKEYLAVVAGHPPHSGTIDLPIARHPVQRQKMTHTILSGRPAVSHYRVLAYYPDAALLAVTIKTGRTHQIRVHLAAIGHGILGDSVYGVANRFIKRQALHAWKLAFSYQNQTYAFRAPIPPDLRELLQKLHHKSS